MTKHVLYFLDISKAFGKVWHEGIVFNLMDDKTPLIRTLRYENSFFPYTIMAWKNLNEEVKSNRSVQSFKKHLNFKRPLWPLWD